MCAYVRVVVVVMAVALAHCAAAAPSLAASIKVVVNSSETPLLSDYSKDAKVVRLAEQGETFTAFTSSLYNGFYLVEDKQSKAFLYLPFGSAEELVKVRPANLEVSGEFPAPTAGDLSAWQVMPNSVGRTDGDDMEKYRSKWGGKRVAHNGKAFPASYSYNEGYRPVVNGAKLVRDARQFLKVPYVLGGTSTEGIDCSGLTRMCLANQGIDVVHRASLQALEGQYVNARELRTGDLIFFEDKTTKKYLSHVGIYLGQGKFIHASESAGAVVVSSLSEKYFKTHYAFARRL